MRLTGWDEALLRPTMPTCSISMLLARQQFSPQKRRYAFAALSPSSIRTGRGLAGAARPSGCPNLDRRRYDCSAGAIVRRAVFSHARR
jgi:hypothetical protein